MRVCEVGELDTFQIQIVVLYGHKGRTGKRVVCHRRLLKINGQSQQTQLWREMWQRVRRWVLCSRWPLQELRPMPGRLQVKR